MMKKLQLALLVMLAVITTASAQYQRRVLIEEFTNASCPPCAAQNPGFNAVVLGEDAVVTPVKYQTNWPGVDPFNAQNPSDVATRVSYYGVTGVPNGFVDGTGIANDCGYYANAPACLTGAEIQARAAVTSPVELSLTHSVTADYDSIIINLSVTSAIDLSGQLRLHVAVIEEEVIFASQPGTNGELDFYQIMRKMLPNGNGTTITAFAAGETKTYTFAWPIGYAYDVNKLGVSAWLQNNTSKEVYNSARSLPVGGIPSAGGTVINSMSPIVCTSGANPTFTLANTGTADITTANFQYRVGTGAWQNYTWTGTLAPGASTVITLTDVAITTAGNTKIDIRLSSTNNGGQTNLVDVLTLNIKGLFSAASPVPFINAFQSSTFPPAGWNISNAGTNGWKLVTNAGSQGSTRSAKNNMFDYDAANTELITPKITLPASSAPSTLVFDHAYAYYNDAYFDSLRVDITADCGATWTTIFHDGYEGLATAPVATAAFTPTADQWRSNTIDLTAYNGSEVIIRFVAESGYGNNAYLDNVNVTTVSGVKNLDLASFTLNPNPTRDVAEVRFGLENTQEIQLLVFDAIGSLVQSRELGKLNAGDHRVSLDAALLTSGTYRVVLQGAEGVAQTQWIVVK
jgi:hypothetical protein